MFLDINVFKEAVIVLKNNSIQNVANSLISIRSHLELAKEDYQKEINELKHLLLVYKRQQTFINQQTTSIENRSIQPWIPLLKRHQQASVYPDVKVATVTNITNAKKEIENMRLTLEELKIRLFEQARKVKLASGNVKKVEKQIYVLELAAEINGFFQMLNYSVEEMAEYEIVKYYELYRKDGAFSG